MLGIELTWVKEKGRKGVILTQQKRIAHLVKLFLPQQPYGNQPPLPEGVGYEA